MKVQVYQTGDMIFGLLQVQLLTEKTVTIDKNDYAMNYEFEIESEEKDNMEILNNVWNMLNADDRPNGRTMRSLSMGDIVSLDDNVYFAQPMGWSQIKFDGFETVEVKKFFAKK